MEIEPPYVVREFGDRVSADVAKALLKAEGVDATVTPARCLAGLSSRFQLVVERSVAHRAEWILRETDLTDAELAFLATGEFPDSEQIHETSVNIMPWRKIEMPTGRELREFGREFGRRAKFLVDETLGASFVEALSELGWNARGVAELGIAGHEDEAIFSRARRERRILITQDRDFLDDRRFPPHRNPGVVVLPEERIESDAFARSVHLALALVGTGADAYRGCKLLIHRDREITLIRRNLETGAMERDRYRLGTRDDVFIWESQP